MLSDMSSIVCTAYLCFDRLALHLVHNIMQIWLSLKNARSDLRQASAARVKMKVYKVAVRPAKLYGLETVALVKRQEAEMEEAELKKLRFLFGLTRMDNIRN